MFDRVFDTLLPFQLGDLMQSNQAKLSISTKTMTTNVILIVIDMP